MAPLVVSSTGATIKELERKLSIAKDEITALTQQINDEHIINGRERVECATLQKGTENLKRALAENVLFTETITQTLREARWDNDRFRREIGCLQSEICRMQSERVQTDKYISFIDQQLLERNRTIEELHGQISSIWDKVNATKSSEIASTHIQKCYNSQTTFLASLNMSVVAQIQALVTRFSHESSNKQEVEKQLSKARSHATKLNDETEKLRRHLQVSQKETKTLRNEVKKQSEAKKFLEHELKKSKQDANNASSKGHIVTEGQFQHIQDAITLCPEKAMGEVERLKSQIEEKEIRIQEQVMLQNKLEDSIAHQAEEHPLTSQKSSELQERLNSLGEGFRHDAGLSEAVDDLNQQVAKQMERVSELEARNEILEDECAQLRDDVLRHAKSSELLKQESFHYKGRSITNERDILDALGKNRAQLSCHIYDTILDVTKDINDVYDANDAVNTLDGFFAEVEGSIHLFWLQVNQDVVMFQHLIDSFKRLKPCPWYRDSLVEAQDMYEKTVCLRKAASSFRQDASRELQALASSKPNVLPFSVTMAERQTPLSGKIPTARLLLSYVLVTVVLWICNWMPFILRSFLVVFSCHFGYLWAARAQEARENNSRKYLESLCGDPVAGRMSAVSAREAHKQLLASSSAAPSKWDTRQVVMPAKNPESKNRGKKKKR
ncbi:Uncharacterized protein LW94_14755 [Fusarium fujikuroi]|nr:Uncharacterized protein LW94_14755 [Fusarium fujikuroi]